MKFSFFKNRSLTVSTLIAMGMLIPDIPAWTFVFCGALILYKAFEEMFKIPPLPRWLISLFALLVFTQLYLQYRSFLDQVASASLLLCLTAIKVLDFRNERDHKFIFLLGFILLALKTLFSFDIIWLPLIFISFCGLWISRQNSQIKSKKIFFFRQASLALPIGVGLFILFPRFILPWAEKRANKSGEIGFSDQINPGTIADISRTNSDVLTAKFKDDLDYSPDTLYWRGTVLDTSTGFGWKRSQRLRNFQNQTNEPKTKGLMYEVALEPQSSSAVFTLEKTEHVQSPQAIILSNGFYSYKLELPPKKLLYYEGVFSPLEQDTQSPQKEDLQTPELSNSLKNWITKTLKHSHTPSERLNALKELFSDGSFTYTNRPGLYEGNDLEDFLFRRRKGFCEHFAASYAVLARGLGIPARVIVGFQGGSFNPYGRFWKITSKDAHAWVEVFFEDQWKRIDPTLWVAPLRIELGGEAFFKLPEEQQKIMNPGKFLNEQKTIWRISLQSIEAYFENLNFQWTEFLLSFNRDSQQSLIDKAKSLIGQIIGALLGVIFLISLGIYFLRRNKKMETEKQIYFEMIKAGEKHGLPHEVDETPLAYIKRFEKRFPMASNFTSEFSKAYEIFKYSKDGHQRQQDFSSILQKWKSNKSLLH